MLSKLIFLPLLGALPLLMVRDKNAREVKAWAFLVSFITFLLSLSLWTDFKVAGGSLFQFEEQHEWINILGLRANFHLGVDGFSSLMILLTTLLTPLAMLSGWNRIKDRQKEFYIAMLCLEAAMIGVFAARDLFLFYVFFEASLLPMYFIIGIWGGEPSEQRFMATTKFVVYTALGSLLMFVGILYIYKISGSPDFSITNIADRLEVLRSQWFTDVASGRKAPPRGFSHAAEIYCFWAFAFAFAIKVALVPLHTWLPDAYNQAPTPGLVLLSGVMAKMGGYGFYRFVIPFFPNAMDFYSSFFVTLAIIGIVYGSIMALAQKELKLVIAYSSIAHLSTCMLGLFSGTDAGAHGALLQMVNHGIYSAGLFLMAGMLHERSGSRSLDYYGGIAKVVPNFTVCFTILTLASIGLPLTNGFVGEFGCLMGAFERNRRWALFGGLGVILGAAYMLIVIRKIFFGPLVRERNKQLADITRQELGILLPLLALTFIMGVVPVPFLQRLTGGVNDFLTRGHYKAEIEETIKASAPPVEKPAQKAIQN